VIVDRKSPKYVQLLQKARELQLTHQVTVGIHVAEGATPTPDGTTSVIDKALANEFGVPELRIPERSFIRSWFDKRADFAREMFTKLVAESVAQTGTETQGLRKFGLWAEADVRAHIREGIPPENAALTIRLKGSSKPLIDKAQMIAAIRARIDGKLP